MAMQALYLKEHEGMLHNPAAQLSSVPSATPWWAAFGTQSFLGDSLGQSNSSPVENPSCGDHLAPAKQAGRGTEHGAHKGSLTQFIFSGNCQFLHLPAQRCVLNCNLMRGISLLSMLLVLF